ncbi:MAG TPA: CCA tRNA nucleotidyltransferase [Verrucomicrobiae bacterium]|nr:CCA tRNA nucleotidyltransferase [Verrucomicrobiae bacterium]
MDLTSELAKKAVRIADTLRKAGHTAYFAGGCVRDHLMKKPPQDFDVATSAVPDVIEKLFPRTIPVGKQFGVMLVVEEGEHVFEVATFRTEGGYQDGRHPTHVSFTGPKEDAARRDFTVNGLFYDPFEEKVIDFVGGGEDLKKKVIRAIGEPEKRFEEDKLRLLRAVRFASVLGFEIEPETWNAVKKMAAEIRCVSPERIRDEVVKILTRTGAARGFSLLSESGLLKVILPELEAMKGVEQPPQYHPEGDVFIHTRMLLEKLNEPSATLALSALFHDVAKPVTYAIRNGKICFYEHAPIGAKMTREIMKRLRFSNEEIDKVSEAVENHMKFADVQKMREGKLMRFIARDNFGEELELHRIDCLSSHGKLDNYDFLKQKRAAFAEEQLKPKPLLNGHDLLAMGAAPGPLIREILDEAYTLQLEGAFPGKAEALAWAEKQLRKAK